MDAGVGAGFLDVEQVVDYELAKFGLCKRERAEMYICSFMSANTNTKIGLTLIKINVIP